MKLRYLASIHMGLRLQGMDQPLTDDGCGFKASFMHVPETSHDVLVADNPKQSSQIAVFIRILDINDHAPEFAMYYETFVCENAKSGQVTVLL